MLTDELHEIAPARAADEGSAIARSAVFRHKAAKDGFARSKYINNLHASFANAVTKFPFRSCLGWRPSPSEQYHWLTYKEAMRYIERVAGGLAALGIRATDRVGLFAPNCKELMLAIQACNRQNFVCVPLYDTLGPQAVEYIIQHAQTAVILTQSDRLAALIAAVKQNATVVKNVVYWGKPNAEHTQELEALGVRVLLYDEGDPEKSFIFVGKSNPIDAAEPTRDDLCTIMYSSGTTGTPKGVMLSHGAILSCVEGQMESFRITANKYREKFTQNDVMLSFLPLAHIFDRAIEELFLANGAGIGYWQGDIKLLASDIEALKPTLFIGVPRVFDRVRDGALATVNRRGPISKIIFKWALARKLYYLNEGFYVTKASPFTDWLVWRKVTAKLGGRIRLVASGSAPLAPVTRDFLRAAMCAPVVEGYGLTETCGSSFACEPLASAQGSVGWPLAILEFCLEAVPEMSCDPLGNPPRGEILIRGPVLFSRYYRDEEKTAEVMDSDGFFHTGDIGELDTNGQLRIIDRKKSLFKLSQGEYISPEFIESVLITASTVEQIFVTGQSDKNAVIAVVVPSLDAPEVTNSSPEARQTFCDSQHAHDLILKQLGQASTIAKLKAFEKVKAIKVVSEPFSVDNGLLTPTFKLKRPALRQKYAQDISQMYDTLNQSPNTGPQLF